MLLGLMEGGITELEFILLLALSCDKVLVAG